MFRSVFRTPMARAVIPPCLGLLALAGPAAAQELDDLASELAAERAAREVLMAELTAERAAREALEARVAAIEAARAEDGFVADVDAQLRALVDPSAFDTAPPRTSFPSSLNPQIGVYSDAVIKVGNDDNKLDDADDDRLSLREIEIDMRLPITPWAEGVFIPVFEDEGDGEYETTVEEGYADVQLGGLTDTQLDTMMKVGRFRVPFGHDNKLHTHDLLQTDRPLAVQTLMGDEGLIGDGVEFTIPVSHRESASGLGRTSTATVAIVGGDMLTGDETLLGDLGDDAGVGVDGDDPLVVARWSEYMEVSPLSDVEIGASYLRKLGGNAIETDADTDIDPEYMGVDVTVRTRDDETGVGGWIFTGEYVNSDFDYDDTAGFPSGTDSADGWWLTSQRQMSPTTFLGLRVGQTDRLGEDGDVTDFTPYFTWYADEFFRIRLQGQHLKLNDVDGKDSSVNRMFLQFSWNFGAHRPHPYWVNR